MPRLVLQDAALADGTSDSPRTGISLAIEGGQIAWIRPNDSADTTGAEVVDAGGATIVPAMVDCHSHLTMQGGSHWIARGDDPAPVLQQVARDNAKRLAQAGILWARDVGAPMSDGLPLSLGVRDELKERPAGHLDEGQPADLVLVHGDPLSDPRALWRVWAVYQRGARVA